MVSMTKEEMVQYLKDYAGIQNMLAANPNKEIGQAFDEYMIKNYRYEDDTREYYDRMRRVYSDYIYFKIFSITEDFLLNRDDYLSNNDLVGIEEDCKFIEKPNNLTNKRIVQLIRNAFNHNGENGIERFRISKNGKNFEIEFNDIRTQKEISNNTPIKPVRIKFNFDYLNKVNNIINKKRQNLMFISFNIPNDFNIRSNDLDKELSRVTFVHYYFNKKMSPEVVNKFIELSNTKGLSNVELKDRSRRIHELAKSIGDVVEYNLDDIQKEKVKYLITRYQKFLPFMLDNYRPLMYYFLGKVIPVPTLKMRDLEQHIIVSEGYFSDANLSLSEIFKRISRVLDNDEKPDNYDSADCLLHDELSKKNYTYVRNFFNNMYEGEFIQIIPIMIYIDSVIMHCCDKEEIIIDGITYNKEKIRNSFAHGRWYITNDNKVVLYDADPRNINDYKLEEVGIINIAAFRKWADNYMDSLKHKDIFK